MNKIDTKNESLEFNKNIETPKSERKSLVKSKGNHSNYLSKSPNRKLIITRSFHDFKS